MRYGILVLVTSIGLPVAAADDLTAAVTPSTIHRTDPPSPERLEALDGVIGDILIRNGDVFDTDRPQESGAFYRVINALHVETREEVIRHGLLVQSGDPFTVDAVAEAERMLRANNFLQDAEIRPISYADGEVDLEVMTEDTWSLTPSVSFAREGGQNTGGIEIEESNLLGLGSEVKLGFKSRVERDQTYFGFHDGQIGESRFELALGVADNSDGSAWQFLLQQPFYSLDAHHAGGIRFDFFDQIDPRYQLGEIYDETTHRARRAEAYYGWSAGLVDDHVTRWSVGLSYDARTFTGVDDAGRPGGLPPDRRDIYPFLAWERMQDRYETTRNADQIERVEDRYLGQRIAARLGYASSALASDDDAWLYGVELERGFKPSSADTVLLFAALHGREAAHREGSALVEGGMHWYHRQSPQRLLYADLKTTAGETLDPDQQITLGGDSGLRGYPLRYQSGNYAARFTLEQRFYSDWYPLRLFRVGAAAFLDAGRIWQPDGGSAYGLGLLRDVGVGLRIGSPRSSTGRMLHIDLAWPLDGPDDIRGAQLVIETTKSF
jgi:hypothetical protein